MRHFAPPASYLRLLACPACGGVIEQRADALACVACNASYRLEDDRAFFTEPPVDYENHGSGGSTPDPATWSAWRTRNHAYFKRVFASLPAESVVVDLGAGPGQFAALMERFATVVAVDFRAYDPVAVVADITKRLPFKDSSVDIVVASNTLEHIPDTAYALAEIHRILKPGGTLVATIPFMMRIHQKPYDFNRYTHYQLSRLAGEAGFGAASVEPLSLPADLYCTIERQFFTYASGSAIPPMKRLIARVLWRLRRLEGILLRGLYDQAQPTPDFTEGYGLTATKS